MYHVDHPVLAGLLFLVLISLRMVTFVMFYKHSFMGVCQSSFLCSIHGPSAVQ